MHSTVVSYALIDIWHGIKKPSERSGLLPKFVALVNLSCVHGWIRLAVSVELQKQMLSDCICLMYYLCVF